MSGFRMRAGISHRSFAGCAILLDTGRDRYWKVDAGTAFALDWVAGRQAGPVDPGYLGRLEQLGLVERCPPGDPVIDPTIPATPHASAIEGEGPRRRFDLAEAIEVAHLAFAARRTLRRHSLASILAEVERSRGSDAAETGAADLARRFDRYRRFVPLAPQCLPDTLAFLRFAGRRGCFPTLIFGVEAWPFAAHCWAQSGDVVLNDALDHARAFSPILAL